MDMRIFITSQLSVTKVKVVIRKIMTILWHLNFRFTNYKNIRMQKERLYLFYSIISLKIICGLYQLIFSSTFNLMLNSCFFYTEHPKYGVYRGLLQKQKVYSVTRISADWTFRGNNLVTAN